jgi:hypothetical protein
MMLIVVILHSVKKPFEEMEEKAIAKLGVTYGVLMRLGFPETKVEECLRRINGVDLDEAYDWVRILFGVLSFVDQEA